MARSAAARTSRKPGQERGQTLAVQTTGDITVVGAYLTVKLSSGPEHETSPDWRQSSDESCLATDLIATSGGASADTRGPYLLARFPNVQSAALAARRLQWASQGFSDTIDRPTEFCILLQSGEESTGEIDERSAWQVFEEAPSGQILLSQAAAKVLESVPAFLLEPGAHGDLSGLKWRAPDDRTNRRADEADIARLVALYNRSESPAESVDQANSIAGQAPSTGSASAGLRPALNRKTVFWIGGVAAAAILAVSAVLFLGHQTPVTTQAQDALNPTAQADLGTSTAQGPATATQIPGSGQPPPQAHEQSPAQPPVVDRSAHDKKHPKQPPAESAKAVTPTTTEVVQVPESKKPEQPSASCQFSSDQIPSLLSQAENLRARSLYRDAQRKFNAVIACQPSNVAARDGLLEVKRAMETEKDR